MTDKKAKEPKVTYEKPVSLHGVPFDEAVKAILKVPPMPKEKRKSGKKSNGKK